MRKSVAIWTLFIQKTFKRETAQVYHDLVDLKLQVLFIPDVGNAAVNWLKWIDRNVLCVGGVFSSRIENIAGAYTEVCIPRRSPGEVNIKSRQAVDAVAIEKID